MPAINTVRSYHVVLADGSERDVKAIDVKVDQGVLLFINAAGELAVAYGHGQWSLVELETRDRVAS
ncbi:MAG TPA: hypothetical protein VFO16_01635 [Pseudonocardiaceae bacterium]|nr:hypothetical protein [Pseudonocardiaceae bacterium]